MKICRTIAEALLWITASVCIAISVGAAYEAHRANVAALAVFPDVAYASSGVSVPTREKTGGTTGLIGRLIVPAIGLSVPVIDNDDPDSLREGVGHVPGTAVAGGLGNLVLAGHRDTFLRALRNIRTGMPIRVVSSEGTFFYVTDSTEIVMPQDVQVADIGRRPEMTLITCYPFNYIGAAPKRFVVHAHLLSLEPS
jgi:sortase A